MRKEPSISVTLLDALAEAIDQEFLLAEEGAMQEVLNRYERRALERGREEGQAEGVRATVRVLLA